MISVTQKPLNTTEPTETVVIAYSRLQDVFYTQQEEICLSSGYLFQKLDWRARGHRVTRTQDGQLVITVSESPSSCAQIRCLLTQEAVTQLTSLYQGNEDHQSSYPRCRKFFERGEERTETDSLRLPSSVGVTASLQPGKISE